MSLSTIAAIVLAIVRIIPDVWSVVASDNSAAETKEALVAALAAKHKTIVLKALEARHNTSDTDDENDRSKE